MFDKTEVRHRLAEGVAAMRIDATDSQLDQLAEYVGELQKWNRVYNLTAIRDPLEMIGKHVLDSLSLLPFIVGDRLIDVGTGAGLPGVPAAIMRPDMAVTLLDSNSKKTRFLTHIQSSLDLGNVKVVHRRVEQYSEGVSFTTVTSRAFASLYTFVTQCAGLCSEPGEIVAMLGKVPEADELEALSTRIISIEPLLVPTVDGERHIARVSP